MGKKNVQNQQWKAIIHPTCTSKYHRRTSVYTF